MAKVVDEGVGIDDGEVVGAGVFGDVMVDGLEKLGDGAVGTSDGFD